MRITKKQFSILLSKLKPFFSNIKLEQYTTNSQIASEWLWNASDLNDIKGNVLDAGCGNGILGIGCLILGAEKVVFVDVDEKAKEIVKENIASVEKKLNIKFDYEIIIRDIQNIQGDFDLVIQNPPFGTKIKHHDKVFLEKAFQLSDLVYSMHKTSTDVFLQAITKDFNYEITHKWDYKFLLPNKYEHHKKEKEYIFVSVYRMLKRGKND